MTGAGGQPSAELGRTLTHGILHTLGRAIVVGRYEARPFPTEAEIAKAYGVSRSVTREAVKMLAAKGLVSGRPRQGTVVQPTANWNLFDTDVLRWLLERRIPDPLLLHLNQLRVAIEPEGAALAARFHTPADLAAIRARLTQVQETGLGYEDVLEADIGFHLAILRASGNPFYAQFQAVVAAALRASFRHTDRTRSFTTNTSDHAAVSEAIAARDEGRARSAMRRMVGDVLETCARTGGRISAGATK